MMGEKAHALTRPGGGPEIQAGETGLAPIYSAARALLGGDGRSMLAGHIAPRPHDLIVDFACGAGDLALQLARLQPAATILGVDRDPALIARAQARPAPANAAISFACAAPDDVPELLRSVCATKVVLTLKDIHSPVDKSRFLDLAHSVLDPRGALFVIDHGAQRTALMRSLFNADRVRRGVAPTDGRDTLSSMIRAAGFVAVDEALSWSSTTGTMSMFRARAS